jgi:hypothetical protein
MKIHPALKKNETVNEQSQSFDNENAYFSDRTEAKMFGHKIVTISHDNYGLMLILSPMTDSGWANIM